MADLIEIANHLYGLPLGEFVAARNTHASHLRTDGEKELSTRVRGLRKPSVGAWTINQLARTQTSLIDEVDALGEQLRSAQETSDGAALRALAAERRALVSRCVKAAGAAGTDGGRSVSTSTLSEVEDTVRAALADSSAADALRSGLLVSGLSPTGFEPVDVTDALAIAVADSPHRRPTRKRTSVGRPPAPTPDKAAAAAREAEDAARKEIEEASRQASEAADAAAVAHDSLADAEAESRLLESTLADLRSQIEDTVHDLRSAGTRITALRKEVDTADRDLRRAKAAKERAERRTPWLRNGDGQ
ncbi:hypothetical protein [Aeromicrobium sp.]|uniref:hypothetical protein n=1 Tax=Aeromicrobium sp. TaxID=1871063 RepID=UPI0019A070C9|nr:hypothetical protein [Aeromicrobium sp.]MBC7629912.1 hypothetical protein [Aeromicrobium sp.]